MKFGIVVTTDCAISGGEKGIGEYFLQRFGERNLTGDQFEIIYAVTGELPKEEDIATYDGFIISGSTNSVNDDLVWIRRLEQFVQNIYTNALEDGRPKMFGICFGHQLIAKALGGRVGPNPDNCFNYGSCEVEVDGGFWNKEYTKMHFSRRQQSTFNIMKMHGEQVVEKPNSARLIGWSQQCKYEILMYGEYILSTQGHPEMTKNMMRGINLVVLKSIGMHNLALRENIDDIVDSDTESCVEMVRSFLRHSYNLPKPSPKISENSLMKKRKKLQ